MTAALSPDLRGRLGAVIQEARRVAESDARQSLAALAVDAARPFDSMTLDERATAPHSATGAGDRRDRAAGVQQIRRLAHEVACEHWHRMLFSRFLAENELLIAPELRARTLPGRKAGGADAARRRAAAGPRSRR